MIIYLQRLASIQPRTSPKLKYQVLKYTSTCTSYVEPSKTASSRSAFLSRLPHPSPRRRVSRRRVWSHPSPLRPRASPLRPPASPPGVARYGVAAIGQTLEGSFSAVSKRNFPSKYAFESSRRDLHNALLCTALKSHFFLKIC